MHTRNGEHTHGMAHAHTEYRTHTPNKACTHRIEHAHIKWLMLILNVTNTHPKSHAHTKQRTNTKWDPLNGTSTQNRTQTYQMALAHRIANKHTK